MTEELLGENTSLRVESVGGGADGKREQGKVGVEKAEYRQRDKKV